MAKEFTQWFKALRQSPNPRRKGEYQVRNNPNFEWIHKGQRLAGNTRYWDGREWQAYKGANYPTIFGEHPSHQWRGFTTRQR